MLLDLDEDAIDRKTVWVIEAPGKIHQMTAILKDLGHEATMLATCGHFCTMPDSLKDVGIDKKLNEFKREPNQEIVRKLREGVQGFEEVFIATDADQEGDVIAVDVAEVIKDLCPSPVRVRLKSLDKESVQEAIDLATPVQVSDAIPGRTRAIVDRLIGAGFAAQGTGAGRIKSAILGIVASKKATPYRLYLTAPSEDDMTWSCMTDILPPLTLSIADQLNKLSFPVLLEQRQEVQTTLPDDMGRIMVKAGDEMNMSPAAAAEAMQAAYQSGRLSYPRSDVRALSEAAANKVGRSLRKTGQRFDRAVVAIKSDGDVHDSPYPIGDVDVNHNPEALGASEGIRVLIARNLVQCGQRNKVYFHVKGPLKAYLMKNGFSEEVATLIDNLPWTKSLAHRMAGQGAKKGLFKRRIDTVLLEKCVEAGLGRPSTYAKHIQNFMDSGLIDDTANLTAEGREALAKTPRVMLNPKLSQAIEAACTTKISAKNEEAPWVDLAARIINALPAEIKTAIAPVLQPEQAVVQTQEKTMEAEKRPSGPEMAY